MMNPSLWQSAHPSSRKRPLDTIQEAGPSRNGASAATFPSATPSTLQATSNHGKSLRERFAESKWANKSNQLEDISQQSLRYSDGAAARIPTSKVEYRSVEPIFAQPHMSMFGTGMSDLNHAPSDHWFSKLRADWLQPKREEPKKKKKKKKVVATGSQPPPPQSPDFLSPTQTISLLPTSAVDTPSALSPTATQYSQDDLVGYEIGTDDGTTLPPSSPMDIDAMRKMVAAFETHTVVDDVTQEMQVALPQELSQGHQRETIIPIIITDVDAEAPSAVETSVPSALLTAFVPNSQLRENAPVLNDVMIKPIAPCPELEAIVAQMGQHFGPAPVIPEPLVSLDPATLSVNRIPHTLYDHFARPHQLDVIDNGFSPSVNLPHAYTPNSASEGASLSPSTNIQATAESTSTKVAPNQSTNRKPRPSQQKKGKPKVLKEGQRNLKNNGIHQCPIPGCTETSSRDYDLKNRHMRTAHPEEALKLGLFKPKKARAQVEGASKLDLNRNMMNVDGGEEGMSEPNLRCPSCFRPYSRRDALIRHAESTINPERKNRPSCNLTADEVRSLRKKYKTK